MYNPENVLLSRLSMHLVCGVSVLNWQDTHIPRTARPARFVYVHRAGWYAGRGAVLGMVGTLWTHLRHS